MAGQTVKQTKHGRRFDFTCLARGKRILVQGVKPLHRGGQMAGLARLAFYFPRVFSSKEAGFTELPTPSWSHFTQRVSGCPLSVTALGVEVVAP